MPAQMREASGLHWKLKPVHNLVWQPGKNDKEYLFKNFRFWGSDFGPNAVQLY